MKIQFTSTRKLWYTALLVFAIFAFVPMHGQSNTATQKGKTIKGVISNDEGPILGANVTLKDSNMGVVTNEKGEFTFPVALKTGDVLLISYVGYKTKEFKIKDNTTFIELTIYEEVFEFTGAPNSEKRYKSKRSN
ncbi:carboxypeptidase-like regulatory domain-containing protein [Kordia jejudonensis]|uniref:carboxypeptidase-like regulatory domain-containing protein n=1 Tax=Kordia jejudonensis TaxID=1348245 RepID=UPI000628FF2C|nr:carboxypeptidase-like regulatory domain-containing protein [Kordia jejudonensis]